MRAWRRATNRIGAFQSHRPKLPVLIAVLLLAACGGLFLVVADQVADGRTQSADQRFVDALRDPENHSLPRGPTWLVDAARDVTALGSTAILSAVVVVAAGYLLLERRALMAGVLITATVTGVFLSSTLKSVINRPRPPVGSALQSTATASFPSGHAFNSAVVYLTLGALLARRVRRPRTRAYVIGVAMLLTLAVGLSRVYLGVHYPTDVLAGWAAGAGWALFWWLVARLVWPDDDDEIGGSSPHGTETI